MADQGNVILALLSQLLQGSQRGLPPLSQMMRGQQVMPGLYDPTGVEFGHPNGSYSSELGAILGDEGRYRLIPSLVPGQVDMQNILAGRKPAGSNWGLTPEQEQIMNRYADSRSSEVPTFKTVSEAEEYEQKRHQGLEAGYRPIRGEDLLSWILSAIPTQER